MVESIFTKIVFTTVLTGDDPGGDLDGYLKFITTHLKARWNHGLVKPCLVLDTGGNTSCIHK